MIKRIKTGDEDGGSYFANQSSSHTFIRSGCTVFDCELGGGWPLGRVSNIVGDASTGKTLLAIEAAANFAEQFDGRIYYREAESAFNKDYAANLGMPIDRVDFGKKRFETVEHVFEDLHEQIDVCKTKRKPGLYIVDSLDALSDRAEMKRKISDDSYGAEKAKALSQLFRRSVQPLEDANMHLMIISQIRDKIGVRFGDKTSKSGGKALNFYSSQIVHLHHLGQVSRTIDKVKRVTGVEVVAKTRKMKVGLPFRSCQFTIQFGFGVDDIEASTGWLEDVGRLRDAGLTKDGLPDFFKQVRGYTSHQYRDQAVRLGVVVRRVWAEVENKFLPTIRKYG